VDVVYACIALHNFINATGGNATAEADELDELDGTGRDDNDTGGDEEPEQDDWKEWRDILAKTMYNNWTAYKARGNLL
jgi:hypothetical protein